MTATSARLSREQRRSLLRAPAGWIACGFGSGLSPVAPGTAGSLAALLPWLALRELPPIAYASVLVVTFLLGVWACGRAVAALRLEDPGVVVWDEFVGQWIALAPLFAAPMPAWQAVAAGFVLFRIFDVAKPWPVSWADRRIGGGFGVMLDDAIAGGYAAGALYLILRFVP